MKKYLAVIAGVILLTTMIQMVEYEWEGYDWVESCYGVECTDKEPKGDWGYTTEFCKQWRIEEIENGYIITPPPCNI